MQTPAQTTLPPAWALPLQKLPERLEITVELTNASRHLNEQCCAIGGENLIQKAALLAFRAYGLDQFRRIKHRVEAYQQALKPVFANAPHPHQGPTQAGLLQNLGSIHADSDISPSNEHWVANMERAYQQLEKHLEQIDELIDACTLTDLVETAQASAAR